MDAHIPHHLHMDFIDEYVDKRIVNEYFIENLSKSGKVCNMLYSALNVEIR